MSPILYILGKLFIVLSFTSFFSSGLIHHQAMAWEQSYWRSDSDDFSHEEGSWSKISFSKIEFLNYYRLANHVKF